MEVFLLVSQPGEYHSENIGVFATGELAKAAAQEREAANPYGRTIEWQETDRGWWSDYPDYAIERFTVRDGNGNA